MLLIILLVSVAQANGAESSLGPQQSATGRNETFEIVPIWAHVHTNSPGDDGSSPKETVAFLKRKGYRGVLFTPHSGELNYANYKAEIDSLNSPDFITIPGREISTLNGADDNNERVMCHLNAITGAPSPAVLDNKYQRENLPDLIKDLDAEKSVYIWNHPWVCPMWEKYAGLFKGIEIFNEFGPGYADGSSYRFDTSNYLNELKKGNRLFVITGIDMHSLLQSSLGEFTAYVFPDKFTRESMIAAIRNGNTLAAFNAVVSEINMRPALSSRRLPGGSFEISGVVGLRIQNGPKPAFNIYKNGEKYSPRNPSSFERGKKDAKGYITYSFSFGDAVKSDEESCYVFEIPHYILSSPYCFSGR